MNAFVMESSVAQMKVPAMEDFVPSCVVCQTQVPPDRAHSIHQRNTCSPGCAAIMRRYHDHVLKEKRCPSCYHPSTPEERRDFIAWRKARGDVREHRGRPQKTTEDRVRHALQEAVELLRNEAASKDRHVADLVSASERFQNLLDEPLKP
jgi:hypothetical protein